MDNLGKNCNTKSTYEQVMGSASMHNIVSATCTAILLVLSIFSQFVKIFQFYEDSLHFYL